MKISKTIIIMLLIAFLVVVSSCGKKPETEPESLIDQKTTEIEKQEVTPAPEPEAPAMVEEVKKEEVKPAKPVDTGAKVLKFRFYHLLIVLQWNCSRNQCSRKA